MKKTLIVSVTVGFLAVIFVGAQPAVTGIQKIIENQKKRDECYAIGVANLPSGEDQTMLQGSHAYEECLNSR